MNADKTTSVTRQYFDAWNEADAAIRQALLEQCWSDDAVFIPTRLCTLPDAKRCWTISPRSRAGGPALDLN